MSLSLIAPALGCSSAMPRKYNRAQLDLMMSVRGGCVALQYTRSGILVGLYNSEKALLDSEGGAWSTVCEEHGMVIAHETRKLAESSLSHPEEWCDVCLGHEDPPE